jgi:hypothetical protein
MMDLFTYERLESLCDMYVLNVVGNLSALRFGLFGRTVHVCPNKVVARFTEYMQEHLGHIRGMAAKLRSECDKATLVIGSSHFAKVYLEYALSLLSDRFRFVIISFTDDTPIGSLDRFEHRIDAIFSTQMRDCDLFSGMRMVAIGPLSRKPSWCVDKRDAGDADPALYVNFTTNSGCLRYTFERVAAESALRANGFGVRPTEPHESMMSSMSRCQFCACPHGIGIDTHRFWEALAAGCAVVCTDWLVLRSHFRGRLPAVWVQEFAQNTDMCRALDTAREQVMDGVWVDRHGDVFVQRWSDVTRARLRVAHRLVGWRRASPLCRTLVQAPYWTAKILRGVRA